MISKVLVILWQCVIFLFSAQPAADSKSLSNGLTEMVLEFLFPDMTPQRVAEIAEMLSFTVRKGAHFTIYFILGALMYNCILRSCKFAKARLMSFVFCVLYAVTDEIHQIFVAGRAGRILDVCIDSFGNLCGIFVVWIVINVIKNRKQPSL